jgi:VanZ family protein
MKNLPWKLLFPVLLFLTALGIFLLSMVFGAPRIDIGIDFMDKIEHAFAYLVLAVFFYLTFKSAWKNKVPAVLVTVLACAAYGGIIEIIQPLAGRTCDLLDFTANAFGALSGSLVMALANPPIVRTVKQ